MFPSKKKIDFQFHHGLLRIHDPKLKPEIQNHFHLRNEKIVHREFVRIGSYPRVPENSMSLGPKVNTVYLYLGHLIEADKLPRHVSKKTFYEHFVKYYEEQWHEPWTGNMETVMETFRVLEATADKVGLESPLGIGHRWKFEVTDDKRSLLMFPRGAMLFFPKDETLKIWLDKLITDRNWIKAPPSPEPEPEPQPQPDPIDKEPETKEPDPERRPPSPEPSEELSGSVERSPEPPEQLEHKEPTKRQTYYARNRTRILAQQQQRRNAVRNGFLTFRQRRNAVQGSVYYDKRDKIWRIQYKNIYFGSHKTEEEAWEVLAKLNTLTPAELAVEKQRLVKPPNGDRKKQEVNPSKDPFQDVVRAYDKLKAEIIKRQDELSEMRSTLKSLGTKKRKFEIEEEERV